MKMIGASLAVVAGVTVGMVAGAYLAMDKPCVRRIYRYGKRYAKKMLDI